MFDYTLPSGRSVDLLCWIIEGTYAGVYEGSRETASQYIRESLHEKVSRILPPGKPLFVIEPPQGELPRWLCVAGFESMSGVLDHSDDTYSRLFVCWFMEDTGRSLDEVIEAVLKRVDWDDYAEDCWD